MEKKEIRKQMISRRDAIKESERVELSARIAKRLFAMNEYKNAGTVLSYASFRSEVATDEINRRIIADGKKLYLPKTYVKKGILRFFLVTDLDADMVSGAMGIMEPQEEADRLYAGKMCGQGGETNDAGTESAPVGGEPEDRTLVIMPGVAFDADGNRMGYGGGFYDRFLAQNTERREHTVMLAYCAQKADRLPAEATDIKPKLILTEEGFL